LPQDEVFDQFVAEAGPALLRFAYLTTRDSEAAKDIFQQALVRTLRRWVNQGPPEQPYAYVRRAIVNEYLSWQRRVASRQARGEAVDRVLPDPATAVVQHEVIWRALADLPRKQRIVLVLRYYEDATDETIAVTLGCRPATVRSLAHRGLTHLRDTAAIWNNDCEPEARRWEFADERS
jgi:RNA polymerase sigma-70 factor (sigma-E family)